MIEKKLNLQDLKLILSITSYRDWFLSNINSQNNSSALEYFVKELIKWKIINIGRSTRNCTNVGKSIHSYIQRLYVCLEL